MPARQLSHARPSAPIPTPQGDTDDAANEAAFLAMAGATFGLTQLQFQWILLNDANSAIEARRLSLAAPEELMRPFAHYWISCSHNTFLDGDQLASRTRVPAHAHATERQGLRMQCAVLLATKMRLPSQ